MSQEYIRYPQTGPSLPLSIANGGTGLTTGGSANQLLGMNNAATALEYKTLLGTASQISVVNAANSITLSLGTIPIANGGTNATSQVTNGVAYFDGTKLTTMSGFAFDGTSTLTLNSGNSTNGILNLGQGSGGAQAMLKGTQSGASVNLQINSAGAASGVFIQAGGVTIAQIQQGFFDVAANLIFDSATLDIGKYSGGLAAPRNIYMTGFQQLVEIAAPIPPNPPSGSQILYIDSSDHKLHRIQSDGTNVVIG